MMTTQQEPSGGWAGRVHKCASHIDLDLIQSVSREIETCGKGKSLGKRHWCLGKKAVDIGGFSNQGCIVIALSACSAQLVSWSSGSLLCD